MPTKVNTVRAALKSAVVDGIKKTDKRRKEHYIPPPNYTQVPSVILDNLDEFGYAELKVLLCLVRQTFGWYRYSKKLTKRRIMELTGMNSQPVVDGLKSLRGNGIVDRARAGRSFTYSLCVGRGDRNGTNRSDSE